MQRRKIILYGLILVGAVTGLVIDRLRPADDEAALSGAGSLAKTTPVAAAVLGPPIARIFLTPASKAAPDVSPSARHDFRDAFALSAALKEYYEGPTQARQVEEQKQLAEAEEVALRQAAQAFAEHHHLKGTSFREDDAWALIDQDVYRLGQELDGFRLVRIDHYRVVFEKGECRVVLSLPVPLEAKVTTAPDR